MRAGDDASAEAELDRLVRRLRGLSGRAWTAAGRRDRVQALLRDLAMLTAPGHEPPELPDHALGDAVAVLGHDGLTDEATRAETRRLIRDALATTR